MVTYKTCRRQDFCVWALQQIEEDPRFFTRVCSTDKFHYTNVGLPCHQNEWHWSDSNPDWNINLPIQHRWKVNVWIGIIGRWVISPYFFEGALNIKTYTTILENDLPVMMKQVPLDIRRRIYWIGLGGPVRWLTRSTDLTPCDFFVLGMIRDIVHKTPPKTIKNMQQRIIGACRCITPAMLRYMRHIFQRRLEVVLTGRVAMLYIKRFERQ